MITVYVGKCLPRGISRAITVQGKMKTNKQKKMKTRKKYSMHIIFQGNF